MDQRQDAFGAAWTDVSYPLRVLPTPVNRAPIIDPNKQYPLTLTLGNPYQIQIAAHDPDGDAIEYAFDVFELIDGQLGDRVYPGNEDITTDADTGTFLWNPPAPLGDYRIVVTVTDQRPDALSAFATLDVTVVDDPTNENNQQPAIEPFNYPAQIEQDAVYTLHVPATEPDGDPLVYDADQNGVPEISIDGGVCTWSSTDTIGDYTIIITVEDGRGGVATVELEVSIVASLPNRPPVFLTLGIPGPATEGADYQTRILVEDPDGDPIAGFSLDAGSAAKSIAIDGQGVLTWTPTDADGGPHVILVTATDARGAATTASFPLSVQLLPVNSKPVILTTALPRGADADPYESWIVAADPDGEPVTIHLDSVTGGAGTLDLAVAPDGAVTWSAPVAGTYTLTVHAEDSRGLASDPAELVLKILTSDPGNHPPVIGSFEYPAVVFTDQPLRVSIPASDADGDRLQWDVSVWKDNGGNWGSPLEDAAITIDSQGTFIWNAPAEEGRFKFQVTVTDPFGLSDTAGDDPHLEFEVRALPANTAPTGHWPAALAAVEGRPFQFRFPVTDAEGDPANYSIVLLPDTLGSPAPAGSYAIDATGLFTWDAPGPVQDYTLTVTARDGRDPTLVKFQDVTLTVGTTNHAPQIDTEQGPSETWFVAANHAYQKQILAHDEDHDPLHFSVDAASAAKGITIDDNGMLRWTAGAEHALPTAEHQVLVTVSDGQLIDLAEYRLKVVLGVNAPPTIVSTAPSSIAAGQPYVYQIRAHDSDGDPLEYVIESGPPSMTFHASEPAVVTWFPEPEHAGNAYAVVLKVYELQPDPQNPGQFVRNWNHFDTEQVTLTVVSVLDNQRPEITSTPARVTLVERTWGYDPIVFDPDDSDFAWSLDRSPAGMTFYPQTGAIRWTPSSAQVGIHDVTLRVSDARGASDTQDFKIEVRLVNGAPEIRSTPETTAYVDTLYIYAVLAVDPENDPIQITAQRKVFSAGADPYDFSQWTGAASVPVGSDNVLRWTPESGDADEPWWILVRVSDGIAGNAQVYPLNVLAAPSDDVPPRITSPPVLRAVADGVQIYRYDVEAHPGGTAIRLPIRPDDFTTASAQVVQMAIDDLGAITWRPTAEQVGLGNALGTITNSQGTTLAAWYPMRIEAAWNNQMASQEFQLLVRATSPDPALDASPRITTIADRPIAVGQTLQIDVQVTDPDLAIPALEERLTLELLEKPRGLQMDQFGRITWTPTAADALGAGLPTPHLVAVRVTDSFGLTDQATFRIFVTADQTPPVVDLTVLPGTRAILDEPITFRVAAVDNVGVQTLQLVLQGATIQHTVALDANGVGYYTPTTLEPFTAVAIAIDAAGNQGRNSATIRFATNPPGVGFAAPADGAEITAPVEISGWVSDLDNNLVSWQLSLVPRDGSASRVLAGDSGSPAPGVGSSDSPATLAMLDPTTLLNGVYLLTLEAVDGDGNEVSQQREIRVAGDLKLGNFNVSFKDLELPVSGIPITVTRSYDTLRAGHSGDFGYGWNLELSNTRLDVTGLYPYAGALMGRYQAFQDGTRVVITLPDGTEEGFTFYAEPVYHLANIVNYYLPRFQPDNPRVKLETPSVPALQREGFEAPYYYTSWETNYNPANFDSTYTLTLRNGTHLLVDTVTGDLQEIEDRAGNVLRYDGSGVKSAYRDGYSIVDTGRGITILRDGHNRVVEIRLDDDTPADHSDNQRLLYEYDPATGDLLAFYNRQAAASYLAALADALGEGLPTPPTLPPPTARFEYQVAPPDYTATIPHYLTKIVDARGVAALSLVYDVETGRIENLADASEASINFSHTTDLGDGRTVEILAAANTRTELVRDDRGNLLRKIEWLEDLEIDGQYTYSVTVYRYTDPHDPKLLTHESFPFQVTTVQVDPYSTPDPDHRYEFEPPSGSAWKTVSQFDASGNLLIETDALGRSTLYSYNAFGQQESQTVYLDDALGAGLPTPPQLAIVTRNAYDPDTGLLLVTIDPEGTRTRFDYTKRGLVEAVRNHDGLVISTLAYNDFGEVTTASSAAGGAGRGSPDPAPGPTSFIVYDSSGNQTLTYRHVPDESGSEYTVINRTRYDLEGRSIGSSQFVVPGLQTYTTPDVFDDANGDEITTDRIWSTSSDYTATGQVATTTDQFDRETKHVYDLRGQEIETRTQTDPDGDGRPQWLVTRTFFDTLGRATHSTDQFLLRENLDGTETIVSAEVRGSRTHYDSLSRVFRTERLVDLFISLTDADEDGIFASDLTALGTVVSTTETQYNAQGRTEVTIDQYGAESRTVYDLAGQVIETRRHTRDEDGTLPWSVTRTVYDAAGRAIYTTDPFLLSGDGQETLVSPAIAGTGTTYDKAGRSIKTERLENLSILLPADTGLPTSTVTDRGTVIWQTESIYNAQGQLTRSIGRHERDEPGPATDYEYDPFGRQTATIGPRLRADSVALPADVQSQVPDASTHYARHRTETHYDAQGRVGMQRTNVIVVQDVNGNSLAQFPEPLDDAAQETSYAYDAFGNRIRTTYADRSFVVYHYDKYGRQDGESQQLRAGTIVEWPEAPGADSFVLVHWDVDGDGTADASPPAGETWGPGDDVPTKFFEYDDQRRLTAVVLPAIKHWQSGELVHPRYEYGYDAQGNQTLIRDNVVQRTDGTIVYDHESGPDHVGPDIRDTIFTFDAQGRQLTRTLPLGTVPTEPGVPETDAGRDGFTEYFAYNDLGQQTLHVSFEGIVTAFVYDSSPGSGGRLLEKQFFDSLDDYNAVLAKPAEVWSYSYDAFGRQTQVVVSLPDADAEELIVRRAEVNAYDTLGQLITIATPEGILHYAYDAVTGRRERTWSTPSFTARYDFGTADSPLVEGYTRVDATTYSSALGHGWQSGSITARNRAAGTALTRDNNATGAGTFAVDVPGSGSYAVTLALGDMQEATGPVTVTLEGQVIDTVATAVGEVVRRTYQVEIADGQLTLTLEVTSGSAAIAFLDIFAVDTQAPVITDTGYLHDDLGRLSTVTVTKRFGETLAAPEETDYVYDLIGNLDQVRLPNGVIADYGYDSLNRLQLLRHFRDQAGGQTATYEENVDILLAEYNYALLADGRRSGVTETHWVDTDQDEMVDANEVSATTIDWFYDSIGRLTREVYDSDDNSLDYATDYLFDLVGNRRKKLSDTDLSGTIEIDGQQVPELDAYRDGYELNADETISYTYDDNDRLLTETRDVADRLDDRLTVYGYDATQQISKTIHRPSDAQDVDLTTGDPIVEGTTYDYNLQGRMSQAVVDSDGAGPSTAVTSRYEYNTSGIRVHKVEGSDQILYLVDGNNPTGYAQILAEMNAAKEIQRTYTLGLDVITQAVAGDVYHLLYDGHGSTRALLTPAGVIAAANDVPQVFAYDAYGNAVGFNPALAVTTLLYSGEQFDQRIAMQYLRARYYNPATGSFNRLDPFFGNLHDPQSLHKYLYVHGDPVQGADPSGASAIFAVLNRLSSGAAATRNVNAGATFIANAYTLMMFNHVLRETNFRPTGWVVSVGYGAGLGGFAAGGGFSIYGLRGKYYVQSFTEFGLSPYHAARAHQHGGGLLLTAGVTWGTRGKSDLEGGGLSATFPVAGLITQSTSSPTEWRTFHSFTTSSAG